jgi:uncharacterized phage protein (TIGR01671 family)
MRGRNREIKFKGFCRLFKEISGWYFGNFIEQIPPSYEETHELLCGVCDIQEKTGKNIQHVVDRDSIFQYTGLKDDDGNEIYEGDILLSEWQSGTKMIDVVGWNSERACFGLLNDEDYRLRMDADMQLFDFDNDQLYKLVHKKFPGVASVKVIGNAYSNPELLIRKDEDKENTSEC